MALTPTEINAFKSAAKTYKRYDAAGLYIEVTPTGAKRWRFKYRYMNKEKLLSFGLYPDVSLKSARDKRDNARELLANHPPIDPSADRQSRTNAMLEAATNTFEAIGREWYGKQLPGWAAATAKKINLILEKHVYSQIGGLPIANLSYKQYLDMLEKIEASGAIETAHRAKMHTGAIFRYAISKGKAQSDYSLIAKGVLAPSIEKNHPSLAKDPQAVGELLRQIERYSGAYITRMALKLSPLLFVRPGELRHAEWTEIDLDNATWAIPGEKMKMGAKHIVPLSTQAVTLLQELQLHTGRRGYVFPGARDTNQPMSEAAVTGALKRMGYGDIQTAHGFRSIASTLLHEQGWAHDAIERQLAHKDKDKIAGAYNYAEYLAERTHMMQHWSDYLDELKAGARCYRLSKHNGLAAPSPTGRTLGNPYLAVRLLNKGVEGAIACILRGRTKKSKLN